MEIFINDTAADITLETEKTLGDVISGIEQWICPSGNRIQKICVNNKEVPVDALGDVFFTGIEEIKKLDVYISSWRKLAAMALGELSETCVSYENAVYNDREQIKDDWEKSPASRFLKSDISDVYTLASRCFSGEGLSAMDLNALLDERIREVLSPENEISASEGQVKIIAGRMEELPLDMQTGKDQRAAETVQLFTGIGEKLFRIFFIQKTEGLSLDSFAIDNLPARTFIEDFNNSLKELSSAYENQDTVLAGDIAEYELSPRLLKFYNSLKTIRKSNSPVLSKT